MFINLFFCTLAKIAQKGITVVVVEDNTRAKAIFSFESSPKNYPLLLSLY